MNHDLLRLLRDFLQAQLDGHFAGEGWSRQEHDTCERLIQAIDLELAGPLDL